MTRISLRTLLPLALVVVGLMAAPTADAYTSSLSAPVTRGGKVVGRATGLLVFADTGWAVANVRVANFKAPAADAVWRTRTTVHWGCADPHDGSEADGETGDNFMAVVASGRWAKKKITGTSGSLAALDWVKECPMGQQPDGSLVLSLAIQNAAGTMTVGRANLFSAG